MSASIFPSTCEIPVDFMVCKPRMSSIKDTNLTVKDADGNKVYKICSSASVTSSSPQIKTLLDPEANPLISVVHRDGGWQGFKGKNEAEGLIFSAKRISDGQFNTEVEIFQSLSTDNTNQRPSFRLKGSPFRRSCTIYNSEGSIIAQSNPLYKLGKKIHSRNRFRLTVYPGNDHSLIWMQNNPHNLGMTKILTPITVSIKPCFKNRWNLVNKTLLFEDLTWITLKL